jgi:hypothetical protein
LGAGNQPFAQEFLSMNVSALAEFIGDELFDAHRGVIDLTHGDFLAFGNDDFATDERAKREVATVRSLTADQASEMGFGTSEDGYSWTLLLRLPREHDTEAGRDAFRALLSSAMWDAFGGKEQHPTGDVVQQYQGAIAEQAIKRVTPRLLKLLADR